MKKPTKRLVLFISAFCGVGILLGFLVHPLVGLFSGIILNGVLCWFYSYGMNNYERVQKANEDFKKAMLKDGDGNFFEVTQEELNKMEKDGFVVLKKGAPLFRDKVQVWQKETQ